MCELPKKTLKVYVTSNGPACNCLAEEFLDNRLKVKALLAEVTLQYKRLDAITFPDEFVTALWQQYEVQAVTATVRLRKSRLRTKLTMIR